MSRVELGRITAIVAIMATLASCSDSTAPQRTSGLAPSGPNLQHSPHACTAGSDVHSIEITPAAAHVTVGQSVQLTAIAHDAHGLVVQDATFCWSVDLHDVSISATGLATGVELGNPATITVTTIAHDHVLTAHAVVTLMHAQSHTAGH